MTDEQLLDAFRVRQDAAAFEELVRRHGPMVLRVCQRVLHHTQDAEDAFQATFIVLARKAGSIDKRSAVGSWLYGVAYRIAMQTRERRTRQAAQPFDERSAPVGTAQGTTPDSADHRENQLLLDEELNRLPEKYRAPLVLCYLEGKTNEQAAHQLRCSEGTVKGLLARGRDRLRDRLARRGLALSGGALLTVLVQQTASAQVPAAIASGTTKGAVLIAAGKSAAVAGLPAQAGALADAAVKAMLWAKMKLYAVVMASVAVVAVPAYIVLQPHDRSLVGHYSFAEGSGAVVKDASASGNHGVLVGGVTRAVGHKPGTAALRFDGKTSHVKLERDLAPWLGGTATVAFWINTTQRGVPSDGFAVPGCVTGVDVSGGDPAVTTNDIQWGFIDESGKTGLCVGDLALGRTKQMEEILVRSRQPINDGQWHHVALTRDAVLGRLEVFVDGKLSATTATAATGPKTTPFFSIGRKEVVPEQSKPAYHFQGLLEDVRFYTRVLKSEEIAALAN